MERYARDWERDFWREPEAETLVRWLIRFGCWLILWVQPAAAQVVMNGDFEAGDLSSWTQFGDTTFSGVDSINVNNGLFSATFGPADPAGGGITQDLATVIGQSYLISYFLSSAGGAPNSFQADFGGTTIQTLMDASDFGFTQFSFLAVATATTTPLSFTFYSVPGAWNLDDVTISAVSNAAPELSVQGAHLPLAAACLLLMLAMDRRRQLA